MRINQRKSCQIIITFACSQVESDGSRSGSSLSLRTVLPSSAGGTTTTSSTPATGTGNNGTSASHSPSHSSSAGGARTSTGNDGNHRGVQRSISASSSSKPRRGSTGAENNNAVICESTTTTTTTTTTTPTQVVSHSPPPASAQKFSHVVTPPPCGANEADDDDTVMLMKEGGTELEKFCFSLVLCKKKENCFCNNRVFWNCFFLTFGVAFEWLCPSPGVSINTMMMMMWSWELQSANRRIASNQAPCQDIWSNFEMIFFNTEMAISYNSIKAVWSYSCKIKPLPFPFGPWLFVCEQSLLWKYRYWWAIFY